MSFSIRPHRRLPCAMPDFVRKLLALWVAEILRRPFSTMNPYS